MTGSENWRKEPPAYAFEMMGRDYYCEPTIFKASADRNKDKARMAAALECLYADVRMTTFYAVWDPEDAERRWMEDYSRDEPAKELMDFWDEDGSYCPWVTVERRKGAVKFRTGRVAA